MKHCLLLAGSVVLALAIDWLGPKSAAAQNAPVVSNVVAHQVTGTGIVEVTYDVSDADGDSVTVTAIFSSNNGVTYDLLPRTITGAVNTRIAPGTGKVITWNAAADFPGFYWPEVVAKVIANDGRVDAGEMVLVPGGVFIRGDNAGSGTGGAYPAQDVTVDSFYVDKFEVTNAEYKRFIDAGGYSTPAYWSTEGWSNRVGQGWTSPSGWGTRVYAGPNYPGFPVTGVSWYEAEAYANFVGKRLLTEAEWEKAARGTDGRTYPWGDALDNRRANWLSSADPNDNFPTPVGYFNGTLYQAIFQTVDSPSPYGAYDMAGNVEEWVRDWYQLNYSGASVNPTGPASGNNRVLRGGSSWLDETYSRTFHRSWQVPYHQMGSNGSAPENGVGFRLGRPVVH